jgi:iron complex outermembrane recepter protein
MERIVAWRTSCVVALALVGSFAIPAALRAQEEEPPAEEAAAREGRVAGETIYVTAQKRLEDVQQVPLSLSTFDAEQIELLSAGGADVKFLSARVPSLLLESSFGRAFPRFYIRGLGNTDFDLNASQPVSMIVDEVVLENPVVKGMPLFDLERTEVLRGPQGTLFGRNTTAGIVKFDSVKPSQERDAYVRASYGRFDTIDFKAAIGGPISDTLSGRASVLYQSQSDWVDNKFTGQNDALGGHDTTAYRLQLLWEPTERFSALLNVHGWDVDGTARIFRANILKPGTNDLVAGFRQDAVFHDGLNQQDIESKGGVLKLDYDLGGATLTSVTGYETIEMYSRGDIDGGFGAVFAPPFGPGLIPFPAESADGIPDLDQFTQEIRIASATEGQLDWLVGFYYFKEDFTAETFSYTSLAPGNPQEAYAFQSQEAKSWAIFGSIDYELSELWSLKAGLRYTTDEKTFAAERPQPLFQTPTFAPIRAETDADLLTWDLSVRRVINENVNAYARVGTGFRAPSIQGRILFCPDFEGGTNPATNCVSIADEEKILSAEVGVKSELLDNRLRANLALYRYQVDDQQLVAVGGQFNTATLLNADTTNGYGFELDSHGRRPPSGCSRSARATTTPRSTTPTSSSRLAAAAAPCSTRLPAAWRASTAIPCRTRRSGSSTASSTTGDRCGRRARRQRRLGLPLEEELLPLRVARVQRRLVRARPARRIPLPRRPFRGRALRPQPDRRGDRAERHRLQQPDRHDQRAAPGGTGARRPLPLTSLRAGPLGGSGQSLTPEARGRVRREHSPCARGPRARG